MEASDVSSGTSQTTETPQVETSSSQPSIAEMMAKHGVKSDGEDTAYKPVSLNSSNDSRQSKDDSPVAPTNETSTNSNLESEKNPIQENNVSEPQIEKEQIDISDWKDLIKNQQPDEVLKELGFDSKVADFVKGLQEVDPKMISFLEYWKNGGNLKEYFEESSKDFSAMPAEDVMRHQLRLDYPKASEAQLEVLYKKEILEKYNLNSYDEDEVNEGKLLLEAKADKYREDLMKAQESKLFPIPPDNKAAQEFQAAQEMQIEEAKNKIVNEFNDNPYTKEVLSKNVISIGEGNDKFTFPIDAKEVANIALYGDQSGELMFNKTYDSNGQEIYTPKSEHQLLVATVNKYGEKFITELAKHYKSLGSKAAIEPLENARPIDNRNVSSASPEPTSAAGAMAKYGRFNSGGW
jgi:hypothetical protein